MNNQSNNIIFNSELELGSIVLDAVKINPKLIEKEIDTNGVYNSSEEDADGYNKVTVKVPEKVFGNKQITENGKYLATSDNLDGFDEVNVNVVPKLQEKTKDITENGTVTIEPDSSFYGLNKVLLNVNTPVPQGSINIVENGSVDVSYKQNAIVNVQPKLQSKSISFFANGTEEIVYDANYDGLKKVIIDVQTPVPSGTLDISNNGNYDVSSNANVNVNVQPNLQEKTKNIVENGTTILESDDSFDGLSKVTINVNTPVPSGTLEITANGNHNVKDKEFAEVNVLVPTLGTKKITANGTYNASDDNLGGYSQVEVETSGVDINDYYVMNATSGLANYGIIALIKKSPEIDFSSIGTFNAFFKNCRSLIEMPQIDTSKAVNFSEVFGYCESLKKIPKITANKISRIYNTFIGCTNLTDFGGLENIGQAFSTSDSANYAGYSYNLNACTKLTHDSLMNVINGLYDIATAGINSQQLILGATNLAKLTSEEITIATNKGWTVS